MSYYKHIKAVQLFQAGSAFPQMISNSQIGQAEPQAPATRKPYTYDKKWVPPPASSFDPNNPAPVQAPVRAAGPRAALLPAAPVNQGHWNNPAPSRGFVPPLPARTPAPIKATPMGGAGIKRGGGVSGEGIPDDAFYPAKGSNEFGFPKGGSPIAVTPVIPATPATQATPATTWRKEAVKVDKKTLTPERIVKNLDDSLKKAEDGTAIKALQNKLGVKADGIWGPRSQAAFDAAKRGASAKTSKVLTYEDKVRRIQRGLGVKADGKWGPQTQTAFDKMKATQTALGVTVDGLRGKETTGAIHDRDMAAVNAATAMKLPTTFDQVDKSMVVTQPQRTPHEMRKEARVTRRKLKFLQENDTPSHRKGGLFYALEK